MRLIERYVYDVTRRLPEKQRGDVARELLAEIHDMVEDRAGDKRPTKKQMYAVLAELGSPSGLADRYREKPRYLIGPDYYEQYISLLRTLFAIIIPILLFTVWMLESLSANHTVGSMLVKLFGMVFEVSLHIFFWTTVSFVFVQKIADGQRHDRNWSPEDLPDLPPEQEITRGKSTTGIGWAILAIMGMSFQIPAVHQAVSFGSAPQFFSPGMWPGWTLGLLALTIASLAVELWKLRMRGWIRSVVVLTTIVNIMTIGFFAAMLYCVDPIINPAFTQFISASLHRPDAAVSVALGVHMFVYCIMVLCVWEIGEAMYKYKKGGKQ